MSTLTAKGTTGVTTTSTQDVIALVGRILIAYLFIPAGIGKLMGFAGTVGYVASSGLPLPQVGAAIAIVVELGIGIAFLLGFKTRISAIVLAVFTVQVLFSHFWLQRFRFGPMEWLWRSMTYAAPQPMRLQAT
jgi:putative oxidoreductase